MIAQPRSGCLEPRGRPASAARARASRQCAVTLLGVIVAILPGHATDAAPARPAGVVEFYAIWPTPPLVGTVPEEYAADDASRILPAIAGDRFALIPRGTVRQVEAAMGWRPWDVLSFSRLGVLAERVGADYLVVGWIRRLQFDTEDRGIHRPGFGLRLLSGSATVLLQIFDASQGRIVAEAPGDAFTIGSIRALVAEQVLHQAVAQALPRVLAKVAPSP